MRSFPLLLVRISLAVCALLYLHAPVWSADDAGYDVVIRNGKIVDGSGNPWFVGDLAIRGDKIVRNRNATNT